MKQIILLTFILSAALIVRLHQLSTPLADWHSWRQADTVAVTRRFVAEGIDLLRPRYDDLSNIPSGKENPHGYRMVEFPFVNGLTAWVYQLIPVVQSLEIHVFSRIISIAFSLGSLLFIYLLVKTLSGELTAYTAAMVFALLPYNIFYSRVVLPEVPLVFFSLGALYFWQIQQTQKKTYSIYFWLSAIFMALALLLKPYIILLLAPPLTYLDYKKSGLGLFKRLDIYIYIIIALAPLVFWRMWITQFPEGIPAFTWLLNGNNIRFKGAFFRWIFGDRFGRLILGYFGLILLSIGIITKTTKKEGWLYFWWLIGVIIYLFVFATGNVQHDYYQIITIPIVSIFVAKGIVFLIKAPNAYFSRITSYSLLIISSLFMLAFGWFHVRGFFNINHPEIVEAGKVANEILPQDAKVIAPYQGDTAFLYQVNRRGWPIGGGINEKIKSGATFYVTTTFDQEAQMIKDNCPCTYKTDSFAVINLQNCTL